MKQLAGAGMVLLILLLSGCLYPEAKLAQNAIPYDQQLESVQDAVDRFREDSGGLLPIKNKDMNTPVYEKYPVDFSKLVPSLLPEAPGTAYESGGIYQYVLINAEKKPEVKLIDLRTAEKIRDLRIRLTAYLESNRYPPYKEVLQPGVFTLDYGKLGLKDAPSVQSPYTDHLLPLLIGSSGEIFVDYRIDLSLKLKETGAKPEEGTDIRTLLTDDSVFVPAFSKAYTVNEKNEPVFLNE
ncbi:hypothetical protein GKZ89_02115 [Bacillus mangrovi]|uniref:ABC transporter periplasmic binding protein yphF n=1 Tax=Metabacillus mangrovi TaxID=1491830 RepID=A0A7X2V3A8_9BACI|nr:hypothetical protein [Metabacillus mangrovi]MTH52185.1 hypothetical protein [Metabacillus mangrovi]